MNLNRISRMTHSNFNADLVTSHLRSQIVVLHNVLETIEQLNYSCESDYIQSSIKTVEKELRRLRYTIAKSNEC